MNSVSLYNHWRPIIPLGRFQPMLPFGLLRGHSFLGSFPAFGYLRLITGLFCLWAKFSPWIQSAHLWPINLLGHFHSIIKYSLLTARYGSHKIYDFHSSPFTAHYTAHTRPIDESARTRPMDPMRRRRPMDPTAH